VRGALAFLLKDAVALLRLVCSAQGFPCRCARGGDVRVHGGRLGVAAGDIVITLGICNLSRTQLIVRTLQVRGGVTLRLGLFGLLDERMSFGELLGRLRTLRGASAS
jgi:hypothetical protein